MGVTHFTVFIASSVGIGDDAAVNASILPVKACVRESPPSHELLTADSRALLHSSLYNGGRQDGELQLRSSSASIWKVKTDSIMAEPELSSPTDPSLRSPRSAPLSLSFPFLREGSRVWERPVLQPGELPSPLPTKRTRTYSATVRANAGPVFRGVCKNFSRSQGHGYIRPAHGGDDIFVHISDIEGEYVPMEGDEVTYKVCPIPPKNMKVQAVEVLITHLKPGTKHETWSGQIISS